VPHLCPRLTGDKRHFPASLETVLEQVVTTSSSTMSALASDPWRPGAATNGSEMADFDEEMPPQGKKWECCATCQGKGKILVDDTQAVPRAESVPLSPSLNPLKRSRNRCMAQMLTGSPPEERRRGNNPFGPRGTLRCLACQRRKKRVA
jgi:hypothetical protein